MFIFWDRSVCKTYTRIWFSLNRSLTSPFGHLDIYFQPFVSFNQTFYATLPLSYLSIPCLDRHSQPSLTPEYFTSFTLFIYLFLLLFSSSPASELSNLWFMVVKLKLINFGELGPCYFMMATASVGYPFGITAHSHGKIGVLPHRMNFSSSGFPLNVEVSRVNFYPCSGSAITSKVCWTFLFLFFFLFFFICSNILFGCQETELEKEKVSLSIYCLVLLLQS